MHNDRGDESIVRAIIDLSHTLGLTVVAEGIENQETLEKLTSMGCDYAQGYHIARPMPPDAMVEWMSNTHWVTCQTGKRSLTS